MMKPEHCLEHSAKFPYDASDAWWKDREKAPYPEGASWWYKAARGVIADLWDRHTIKWGFNNVEEKTRVDIVDSLAEIVRLAWEREQDGKAR
ncbi:MAG: hypothetical protein GY937_20045 [bacterium]|nr:hypothetical protein [bacterium]